jgi:hypothetical protein
MRRAPTTPMMSVCRRWSAGLLESIPSPKEGFTMYLLPTPYPPVWMEVTASERRQQALAAAEQSRRLAQLRPIRRGHPAIVGALFQAVGTGLIRLGTRLQGPATPGSTLGPVEAAP